MRETKSGKRLLPLVQLLPAVAVAGLVLVTVPRTAPVLAAVPERLAEAASERKSLCPLCPMPTASTPAPPGASAAPCRCR